LVTVAGHPSDDLAPGTLNSEQHPQAGRAQVMKLLIVVEQTSSGFSAYAPDVPGCVATGSTRDAVERTMREAIEFHLEGLRAEGMAAPEPHAYATVVAVAAERCLLQRGDSVARVRSDCPLQKSALDRDNDPGELVERVQGFCR
jgi:predicted RNase H-like HicB family nuclease